MTTNGGHAMRKARMKAARKVEVQVRGAIKALALAGTVRRGVPALRRAVVATRRPAHARQRAAH